MEVTVSTNYRELLKGGIYVHTKKQLMDKLLDLAILTFIAKQRMSVQRTNWNYAFGVKLRSP